MSSMTAKKQLHADGRGVVSNFSEMKAQFYHEELTENRRGGISFSSIGKIGIDNTKDEVLCVYEVMLAKKNIILWWTLTQPLFGTYIQ